MIASRSHPTRVAQLTKSAKSTRKQRPKKYTAKNLCVSERPGGAYSPPAFGLFLACNQQNAGTPVWFRPNSVSRMIFFAIVSLTESPCHDATRQLRGAHVTILLRYLDTAGYHLPQVFSPIPCSVDSAEFPYTVLKTH